MRHSKRKIARMKKKEKNVVVTIWQLLCFNSKIKIQTVLCVEYLGSLEYLMQQFMEFFSRQIQGTRTHRLLAIQDALTNLQKKKSRLGKKPYFQDWRRFIFSDESVFQLRKTSKNTKVVGDF